MTKTRIVEQLPVIAGQPYTPKRNVRPWSEEVECENPADCQEHCYCSNGPTARHKYADHPRPHKHTLMHSSPKNGSGWLERKSSGEVVYHAPWIKTYRPFKMPELKSRIETPEKTLARLRKECTTPEADIRHIGRHTESGYVMTATNGHWALLEHGIGSADKKPITSTCLDITKDHHVSVIASPEFYLLVKRASLMAGPSQLVTLFGDQDTQLITAYSDRLMMYSISEHGDFLETLPAVITQSFRVALAWHYLEMPLGTWPISMWVKDENSPVVFTTGKSWRFVLMPMDGGITRDELGKKLAEE